MHLQINIFGVSEKDEFDKYFKNLHMYYYLSIDYKNRISIPMYQNVSRLSFTSEL